MAQASFDHGGGSAKQGPHADCTILASRDWLRAEMVEDARAAGLAVSRAEPLFDTEASLGAVVLVDCPTRNSDDLALLERITARAAEANAALLVSASMDSLDAVYAALPHSDVPLLVDPTRVERVIALGGLLATMPHMGVKELSDLDRQALLRLTEQVGEIAQRLEGLAGGELSGGPSAFRFGDKGEGYRGEETAKPVRARPSLPDPRLVRSIIRQRQARAKYFGEELFADPAWDILLDLTAAHAEHERVSVTSLCIASGVPPTTALRWITQMIEAGLLERVQDSADKRRAFIRLTDRAADGMARYFAEIAAEDTGRVV